MATGEKKRAGGVPEQEISRRIADRPVHHPPLKKGGLRKITAQSPSSDLHSPTSASSSWLAPTRRFGSASCVIDDQYFLVFGGQVSTRGGPTDESFCFEIGQSQWHRAPAMPIGVRHHHTFTSISPTSFIVFGGKSQRYHNDLWRVELLAPVTAAASSAAAAPSATQSGIPVFRWTEIVAGAPASTSTTVTGSKRWSSLGSAISGGSRKILGCGQQGCPTNNHCSCGQGGLLNRYAGQPPSPRYGHTTVIYNQCLWVFGGYDTSGLTCNDLHKFDLRTSTWEKIDAVGLSPPGVYHHTAVVFQGSMYIFGGSTSTAVYEYRFGTQTWSTTIARGYTPRPRFGHAATVWREWMIIFGGFDPTSDDQGEMYHYSFRDGFWSRVDSSDLLGLSRSFACAGRTESRWWIHGGRLGETDTVLFDDLLEYTFDPGQDCLVEQRPFDESPCTFESDFLWLLTSGHFADTSFICTGQSYCDVVCPDRSPSSIVPVPLFAHRNIVLARCPSLQVLFQDGDSTTAPNSLPLASPTASSSSSASNSSPPRTSTTTTTNNALVATIDFIDAETFAILLRYFYGGVINLPADASSNEQLYYGTLVDLLRAAHRLSLAELHEYCQIKLVGVLNEARLPNLYALAQETQAPRISEVCRVFALQNIRLLAHDTKRALPKELLKQLAKEHATGRILDAEK